MQNNYDNDHSGFKCWRFVYDQQHCKQQKCGKKSTKYPVTQQSKYYLCGLPEQKVNATHWTYKVYFDVKKIDSNLTNLAVY